MVGYIYVSKASIKALKISQKSWRTLVRLDISSTFCQFELMTGRTNVLDLYQAMTTCFHQILPHKY